SRLRLLPPEGMRVTPQEPIALRPLGPGESADVAFGLEGESQKALFIWAELAAGDLRIGSRLHLLVSDSAVRMELGPERFAAGLDGQRAVVWLSDQLSAPLEGFVRLSAEQGWRIMPERIPVTLQPGQRRRAEFAVSVPETAPDRAKMTAAFEAAQAKTGSQAVFTVRTAKGLPRVVCRRMAQPPRIDGALDDPCWAAAESVPLQLMRAPGEQKVKTLLRLGCDDKHLYLAVWCWEPLMSALVTGRDPLWSNDDVEIFVEPFHRGQVQFIITADGRRNEPVSSPWRSAVARGPDWWSVEVSIPWAALGPDPPQPGDTWGLNVGRAARPHTEHHALSPRKGYKEDLADLLFAE
ncbi:MAG: hypothetical protein FJ279_33660, partial [Planctomycetes bacterium]|nr:hypothetical protein [Planctomycetota bacterium]